MNRFAQQFAQNRHLSFKQKNRSLIIQIFGNESLIDTSELCDLSYCETFNEDIYRLHTLKKNHIAYRKLFNPFKWLEYLLVTPLELLSWVLDKYLLELLSIPINAIIHTVLAIPKRILAPARYIIRPAIELAKTQPKLFAVAVALAIITIAAVTTSVFTGGLPILLAGIITASTAITAWPFFISLVANLKEGVAAIINMKNSPGYKPEEEKKLAVNSSTKEIAFALHAINPKLALINKSNEQHCKQTVALITGTEALFYPAEVNLVSSSPSSRRRT